MTITRILLLLALSLTTLACTLRVQPTGGLCSDTCRWANDGECDDGGEGAEFDVCELGTDCGDCGPREAPRPPGMPSTPTDPAPTYPTVDHGIPADFPPLSTQYRAHATWRHDSSGFADMPNEVYASIDEIPVKDGVETFGALWRSDVGAYTLDFVDASAGHDVRIELRSLDVGVYDATGFDGVIERTEHRGGSYTYVSDIAGGSGTVEIVGRSETALWGRFSGRFCYRPTPGVNCSTVYDGRFSATLP